MHHPKVHIGGVVDPFWRYLNTEEWEPEWRSLVNVLDREHLSVDFRIAIQRLWAALQGTDAAKRLEVFDDWVGYLDDVSRHERMETLCEILTDMLERGELDVVDMLLRIAMLQDDTTHEAEEHRLCLRLLRGMCLLASSIRARFIGEVMQVFLQRLLEDSPVATSSVRGEVIELLLVVISESPEYQRDFMRRNGVTTVCTLYSRSRDEAELFERAGAFINALLLQVLPSGASSALSNALTAEAQESVEEALGEDELQVILAR
jgi:hypothetical protein